MGSNRPLDEVGSCTVTSASSPTDTPAGGLAQATCAMRSSVTASASSSSRATVAAWVWPGCERSTTWAVWPTASPAARPWSMRVLTHRLAGSTSRSTAWPATTVVPGSASRVVTTPAAGASRRTLPRCCTSAARSAARRCTSWPAPTALAWALCSAALAEASSCWRPSSAPGLMKDWRARSSLRRRLPALSCWRASASCTWAWAAAWALRVRASEASSAAMRWSRSTGSISASSWPGCTLSPTSASTRSTRPAAVGPTIQPRRASTVPMPKAVGLTVPVPTCATVTLTGASGPLRTSTNATPPSTARPRPASNKRRPQGFLDVMAASIRKN